MTNDTNSGQFQDDDESKDDSSQWFFTRFYSYVTKSENNQQTYQKENKELQRKVKSLEKLDKNHKSKISKITESMKELKKLIEVSEATIPANIDQYFFTLTKEASKIMSKHSYITNIEDEATSKAEIKQSADSYAACFQTAQENLSKACNLLKTQNDKHKQVIEEIEGKYF